MTSGTWHNVMIAGKPADVFEPQKPDDEAGVVLFLHGHGGKTLRDNATYTALFEAQGLRVVCPHAGPCWWVDRVCPEFDSQITPESHLEQAVVPWIADRWQIAPPYIALLGVSMGGQGALRFAYRHGRDFPTVAALAPLVDFHVWYGRGWPLDSIYPDAEAARQDTATLHIHPLNYPRNQFLACDPGDNEAWTGTQQVASKLNSSGILFDSDFETRAGGHTWDYFNRVADKTVTWIAEKLRREHLRIP